MAEQLKELIEKIQEEGVKAAEEKARVIEEDAVSKAKAIVQEAEKKAQSLIIDVKGKITKMEEGTKASLRQVSRDILLALKKEVNETLSRIISQEVRKSMTVDELKQILSSVVKAAAISQNGQIVITLKKDDAEKLENGFLAELKKVVQAGVVLKTSDDIRAGFTISYDFGKSFFDFTDKALAEYIGTYLKPKLAEILL